MQWDVDNDGSDISNTLAPNLYSTDTAKAVPLFETVQRSMYNAVPIVWPNRQIFFTEMLLPVATL